MIMWKVIKIHKTFTFLSVFLNTMGGFLNILSLIYFFLKAHNCMKFIVFIFDTTIHGYKNEFCIITKVEIFIHSTMKF